MVELAVEEPLIQKTEMQQTERVEVLAQAEQSQVHLQHQALGGPVEMVAAVVAAAAALTLLPTKI